MTEFSKGDRVYFGRGRGEQTLGVVVKVNAKSLKVSTLEARGTKRHYPVGTVWKVAKSLCTKAGSGAPSLAPVPPAPTHAQRREAAEDKALEAAVNMLDACSMVNPPEYIEDSESYLTGHALDRWGRERDSQKQRLYRSEKGVCTGNDFSTVRECQRYLDFVTGTDWFVERFGDVRVRVVRSKGYRASRCYGKGNEAVIRILGCHQNSLVLLHELTHALVPHPHASHGPLYCRVYAEMVKQNLGFDAYEQLMAGYRREGVKHRPQS